MTASDFSMPLKYEDGRLIFPKTEEEYLAYIKMFREITLNTSPDKERLDAMCDRGILEKCNVEGTWATYKFRTRAGYCP